MIDYFPDSDLPKIEQKDEDDLPEADRSTLVVSVENLTPKRKVEKIGSTQKFVGTIEFGCGLLSSDDMSHII